jgi:enoyl-CoA hydratase/carnithine racemase
MAVIEVSIGERRADVILHRPEVHNAMNWEVWDGLAAAADEIAASAARVAVFSGEGASFSSGIDTTMFGEMVGTPKESIARAQSGHRAIAALRIPTIAAIHGHCYGAGLQLALACDLRIVTRDASLGLFEARFGLVPDLGGTIRLPRLVGPAQAKKLMWLAERISGEEAARIGLADEVVDGEGLAGVVDELAARLAQAPPLAVSAIKRLVDSPESFEAGMDAVAVEQLSTLASADLMEGVTAFAEKRSPQFAGS